MAKYNVTGVSEGIAREVTTAGTIIHGNYTVNNIVIVQHHGEDGDEFHARLKGLLSTLPGDTRLLTLKHETNVLLIGKVGVGKSALGNIVLNERVFRSSCEFDSCTTRIEARQTSYKGESITVIDTPSPYYQIPNTEISQMFKREHLLSRVHVVLYVVKVGRYTEEDTNVYKFYKYIFGDNMTRHTMVVFTWKGDLDEAEITVDKYISDSSSNLKQFLHDCGGGYIAVNNIAGGEEKKNTRSLLLDRVLDIKRN